MFRKICLAAALLLIAAAFFLLTNQWLCRNSEKSLGKDSFRAPMAQQTAPGKKHFRVAVFSDFTDHLDSMEKVAAALQKQQPDFVLCLGDMVRKGSRADYRYLIQKFRRIFHLPVYVIPGNWDRSPSGSWQIFRHFFGRDFYSFQHGDTLFIALNSAEQELSGEQLLFLRRTLETKNDSIRRKVVFCHIPPVDPRPDEQHSMTPAAAEQLRRILQEYPVQLILCGHIHHFTDTRFDGCRMVTTPSSGQEVRDPDNPMFGYLLLNFLPDGNIRIQQCSVTDQTGKNSVEYFFRVVLCRGEWLVGAIAMLAAGILLLLSGCRKPADCSGNFPS